MAKPKRKRATAPGRGHALAMLRAGNAAGLHVKRRPDRHNSRRRAVADDLRAG
jgi:hypothetical protein